MFICPITKFFKGVCVGGWGLGGMKLPVHLLHVAVRRQASKQRDLGLNPLRLSFLFESCGLWTLSCDFVPHN